MAELKKVNDFHYEAPEMDQPTVATEQDRKMQEETLPVPALLPKKKLKNVFYSLFNSPNIVAVIF